MPSATGSNWEKYRKNFADDEEPEKKITPLTDEFVLPSFFLWIRVR
jgi:26S proteasome regulatory subunit T1